MSVYMILTIVIVVVWLAIGVGLSIMMGRRGHISVGWGALGAMLGPLAIVAAVATSRHEKEEVPSVLVPATPLGGAVDVLVGIDGSVECRLALQKIVALLGPGWAVSASPPWCPTRTYLTTGGGRSPSWPGKPA